ncbi:LysR family transcriptional regulator [Psychrobacter phenylpyruvicus]|uniref:HTH-type transcriptional regulator gltC n=1 Tax=Psychrobacter phenylpyruvicus TaxID=29432 RepID=A0A379LJE5_9GAMM|nr:LysR family transcriptional regulator [Psychrobacter phenylpyruvicus]SUD90729.1 HTH-type transcriptional regulator gltC [Psychrobacter phenylpyruvicus]
MNIKLQQLRHLLYVVEEGGFRAAASQANRSQATLSSSIKALENELGRNLFEPGNNSTLTPFGEECVPKIKSFMQLYHRLETDLQSTALGKYGKIRIATVPSIATKLLPDVLAEFSQRYPDVEISLVDDNSVGVCNRLLTGEVDIALGNLDTTHQEEVVFSFLLADPIGVVCTKNHRLAQFTQGVVWQELLDEPFIYNGTCHLLNHTPAYEINIKPRYEVGNITSLFSLLRNGLGVTTLPKLAFPEYDNHLIWIPLIDPDIKRQIGMFSIANRTLSPQVQVFSELCSSYIQSLE